MHTHVHDEKRMLYALLLTGGFMVIEVIGGLVSGSLALLADAGHMLTDTASLALAWIASRASRKPADSLRTYGYQRLQVLAAFTNSIAFVGIVVWILIESIERILSPGEILSEIMLLVAGLGLLVNIAAFYLLHGGSAHNINLRAAMVHVIGDLLGSMVAIIAAIVIMLTAWTPVDPLLSILVAFLILHSAWKIVRRSTHILLEGTPEDIDIQRIKSCLEEVVEGVQEVHHVHVWSLTPDYPILTMHVRLEHLDNYSATLSRIQEELEHRFGIQHATIQIEIQDTDCKSCEGPVPHRH